MSVRWDPLLASAVARELDRRLGGARVRALLLDRDTRRVALFLRDHTLVAEMHPLHGWITLLPSAEPPEGARPLPAKVRGVGVLPDESALVLQLPRVRGREEGVELVLEFVGNRWNAAVVGHRSRQIRHVLLSREGRGRTLAVGAEWKPPPSTGRAGAEGELADEAWPRGGDGRRTLLERVAWTSSLNAPLFLGPDGLEAWRRAVDPENHGAWLLETPRGPQPYPVRLPGHEATGTASLLEAFRRAREAAVAEGADVVPTDALVLDPALMERGRDRVRRAERRLRALERELAEARDPAPVRALGDLILARYAEVPRGRERATLPGFEGGEVEVELDPTLSPDENAARYYDEAARLERARAELPQRIEAARSELRSWARLVEDVASGETPGEELARRLGPEADRREGGSSGRGRATSLPWRRFRSSGGLEIRVGRGARANDDLTFRHSSPDDVWLHVRQAPGAHVILRWGREGNPPARDLAEAAVLAALHSEARHSGSVPVDWTRRKYVRKPRGAAPGAVVPDRVQTLFVEPDPRLRKRLAVDPLRE